MKNKKLFAILTLVCFMFTLMPVAAFAAVDTYNYVEVTGNTTVERGQSVDLLMDTDFTTTSYYVFAYKDGVYSSQFGIQSVTFGPAAADYTKAITMNVPAGNYELYVVDANSQTEIVMGNAALLNSEKAAKMLADTTKVSMLDNDVVVTNPTVSYYVATSVVVPSGYVLQADNGYTALRGTVTVKSGGASGQPVPNVDVNVYTDSYGLQVTKLDAKTNAKGEMDILVTGTVPGTFNVYAEFGGAASTPVSVTVGAVNVSEVKVVAEPTAPVARTVSGVQSATAANSGIEFQLTDKFGTVADPAGICKVTLIEAPTGVDKTVQLKLVDVVNDGKDSLIKLSTGADYNLAVNGTYTFKVALQNGASATASVTVADFGKTTAIKFEKTPVTVAYGSGPAAVLGAYGKVVAVDAKGVTKDVTAVLSVNGSAVSAFDGTNLTVKNDVDYVGSTITVIAVYTDGANKFTATHDLTVVDEAALIKFTSTEAEVGATSTLYAYVLDSNGKAVTLPAAPTTAVQAIVLDKPANSVATISGATLNAKGQVEFDLLASAAGEYKIQTIVTFNGKYVSSIDTFTVGAGEGLFDNVVVMSIGANNIVVNSDLKAIAAAPMIKDNRTFVPFRALAEAFGANVEWVEATQSVVAELNGVKVVMNIGENAYTVNGAAKTADVAPFINGASTMVPVRFVAEAFGINVTPIYAENGAVADVLFAK